MAESNNNKEWMYVLVGVGITLLAIATILSFLTYRKVDRQSYDVQQPMQQLSIAQMPGQIPTSPVVYDERIYKMISDKIDERDNEIHEHMEDINSNINSLRSLNYTPYKMPNQRDVTNAVNMANMNKLSTPRAGSVTTIRTTTEDKTRQRDFGMI